MPKHATTNTECPELIWTTVKGSWMTALELWTQYTPYAALSSKIMDLKSIIMKSIGEFRVIEKVRYEQKLHG